MNTLENGTQISFKERLSESEQQKRATSLASYEYALNKDQNEHQWWSFFDGGMQDENGACWVVHNHCDEVTQPYGWKVGYSAPGQTEFCEIQVTGVIRTDVYPAYHDRNGLTTFQLGIHDEAAGFRNNDVLNLLLYHNDYEVNPELRMWNHSTNMTLAGLELGKGQLEGAEEYLEVQSIAEAAD